MERRIGYASSASSFTNATTTYNDVTGIQVTAVHTRTGYIRYRFHSPSNRTSTAGYLGVKLFQDATTIDQSFHSSSANNEWGGLNMDGVYNLAAGTYTFKVQMAAGSATYTAALNDNSLGIMSLTIWEDIA